jgi:hypothetical protein
MTLSETGFRIPLPSSVARSRTSTDAGQAGHLVADFLSANEALSCEAVAELAGVRTETIRKWRRRLPCSLRDATSRRMRACLAGKPLPGRDEGFQRLFRRVLRSGPGGERGPMVQTDRRIPP